MATTSQVKDGLDQIAAKISLQRTRAAEAKARLTEASAELGAVVTEFADVKATIDGFTPTGAFETMAKDELAKMSSEFSALKNAIDAAVAEL